MDTTAMRAKRPPKRPEGASSSPLVVNPNTTAKSPPRSPRGRGQRSPTQNVAASAANNTSTTDPKQPRSSGPMKAPPQHNTTTASTLRRAAQSVLPAGTVVQRNPRHWRYGDQDGGAGLTGVVLSQDVAAGVVMVRWYQVGNTNRYRFGHGGVEDVVPSTSYAAFETVKGLDRLVDELGQDAVRSAVQDDLAAAFRHPLHLCKLTRLLPPERASEGFEYRIHGVSDDAVRPVLEHGLRLDALEALVRGAMEEGGASSPPPPPPPQSQRELPAPEVRAKESEEVEEKRQEKVVVPSQTPQAPSQVVQPTMQTPPLPETVHTAAPVFLSQEPLYNPEGVTTTTTTTIVTTSPPRSPRVVSSSPSTSTRVEVLSKLDPAQPRLLKLTLKGDVSSMPMVAIKKSLEAYTAVPAAQQVLERDGVELGDQDTGLQVGLRHGTMLTLRSRPLAYMVTESHGGGDVYSSNGMSPGMQSHVGVSPLSSYGPPQTAATRFALPASPLGRVYSASAAYRSISPPRR